MINLSDTFCEIYLNYRQAHKPNQKSPSFFVPKYTPKNIFDTLFSFIRNNVYFSRFNNFINGRYLNEIHNFLIAHDFYDILYKKILSFYIALTNEDTLDVLAVDSSFIRNINGFESHDRNPLYYNKPGFKIHVISDKLKTPISLSITSCTENDSISLKKTFDNVLIDKNILADKRRIFLMDSGYDSFIVDYFLTENGYEVYSGYNKKNGSGIYKKIDNPASDHQIKMYKKRGISENCFAILQRYPAIINNYEKTIKSYRGLLLFALSIILHKKCVEIENEKKNSELVRQRNEKNEKEKQRVVEQKMEKKKKRLLKEQQKKLEDDKRKLETNEIKKNIIAKIYKIFDEKNVNQLYDNYVKTKHETLNFNIKNKQKKNPEEKNPEENKRKIRCIQEQTYKIRINDAITSDIIYNVIFQILTYEFGKKTNKMLHIEPYAFGIKNMENKLKEYNWNEKIMAFSADILLTKTANKPENIK